MVHTTLFLLGKEATMLVPSLQDKIGMSLGILTKSRSHRMEYSGKVLNSLLAVISPRFWAAADYIPSAGER